MQRPTTRSGLALALAAQLGLALPLALPAAARAADEGARISGFWQFEGARTVAEPDHGSKLRNRVEVTAVGALTDAVKWKLSGGAWYDSVFGTTGHYLPEVADDRRSYGLVREAYLDFSAGDFDIRLGRQQIVWGEVIGLFVGDVVSALDLRDFILPEFNLIRIPQWAARAEYTKGDFHGELVWVPKMSYSRIGKPNDDFYPYPPTAGVGNVVIGNEVKPSDALKNSAWGARAGYLYDGWDGSLFYYRSYDVNPTFYRDIQGVVAFELTERYTPRHDRIWQVGGTVTKDFEGFVLKAEGVYTANRGYTVARPGANPGDPVVPGTFDGVVKLDAFDGIVSLDYVFENETRVNGQLFGRFFADHDPDILQDRVEGAASLYVSGKLGSVEPDVLMITSLNRSSWMVQPQVKWGFARNWRLLGGAAFFGGEKTGFLGRYDASDRVYAEVRYSF